MPLLALIQIPLCIAKKSITIKSFVIIDCFMLVANSEPIECHWPAKYMCNQTVTCSFTVVA